ncbi:aspartic peptidase domain-containing protein [Cerioporus squamosus]|nr:aspartic peptidase domain-containing protein [Cerioporus squamosus]
MIACTILRLTQYVVDIALGGQNFSVQLDTGSNDLVLNQTAPSLKLTNATPFVGNETYGSGWGAGRELFAELEVGPSVVPSQAFVNISESLGNFGPFDGILGTAPASIASNINANFTAAWGRAEGDRLSSPFLNNLFAQNPSMGHFFDLQLSRTSMLGNTSDGIFAIGKHASGHEGVGQATKLHTVAGGRWGVIQDGVSVDGAVFKPNTSRVPGTPAGKLVSVLDSGTSLASGPAALAEAIYSSMPHATFSPTANMWYVLCNSSANLTFTFGGQDYHVHPLEVTLVEASVVPLNGKEENVTVCYGGFQPVPAAERDFQGFDLVLGDVFMKSVYTSFNFGDDYDTANSTSGTPYIQLQSTVPDAGAAWEDFLTERKKVLEAYPPQIDPATFVEILENWTST